MKKTPAEQEAAQTEKDVARLMAHPIGRRLVTDDAYREAFSGKPGDEAALRLRLEAAERLTVALLKRCDFIPPAGPMCCEPVVWSDGSRFRCDEHKRKEWPIEYQHPLAPLIRTWLTAKGLG